MPAAGAIQGQTDFGFSHYGGPCPPVGDHAHHYEITVYALKVQSLQPRRQHAGNGEDRRTLRPFEVTRAALQSTSSVRLAVHSMTSRSKPSADVGVPPTSHDAFLHGLGRSDPFA